jgi:hypothetical protein
MKTKETKHVMQDVRKQNPKQTSIKQDKVDKYKNKSYSIFVGINKVISTSRC